MLVIWVLECLFCLGSCWLRDRSDVNVWLCDWLFECGHDEEYRSGKLACLGGNNEGE